MILYELLGEEANQIYQGLQASNLDRQYQFLRSIVDVAICADRPFLSQTVIKAINFHAIVCLHVNAGEYRPCEVHVTGQDSGVEFEPPQHFRVNALMDDFVNTVNRYWQEMDAIQLAAYVLWRINWIHPFINGNGRTARAASFFVLCVKANVWVGRREILPELLRQNRSLYVDGLRQADAIANESGDIAQIVAPISDVIVQLLTDELERNS